MEEGDDIEERFQPTAPDVVEGQDPAGRPGSRRRRGPSTFVETEGEMIENEAIEQVWNRLLDLILADDSVRDRVLRRDRR